MNKKTIAVGLDAFNECESILVVAAHPDDLETMCGGTLLMLRSRGTRVDLLLATDGDRGDARGSSGMLELALRRREESRRAAEKAGVENLLFLGYHDGELVNNLELRRQIAHAYRRLQPDTIFTFDPLAAYRSNLHPDHTAISQAAIDAYMPAKMPLYHPEQLGDGAALSRVKYIFCFATLEPDVIVPVDSIYAEKVRLSLLHESQFPNGEASLEWMRERDQAMAARLERQEVEYAEGFRRIPTY